MNKLLIIDDDIMIREGIKNAIVWEKHGIDRVETADNGEEGWDIFKELLPDIVLTDIRMPGKDGLELLSDIKQFREETKVIILSGYDDFSYAQTAIKSGAFDYLLKTSDARQLLESINKANQEIERTKRENEQHAKLKQQLSMSLPLLRYRHLNELLYACIDYYALMKKLEFVDVKFSCNSFLVAVAEADVFILSDMIAAEEERLLTKLQVINTMEELV